ncbi:hypothetical protein BJ508DRAFT_300842 [Ascobolus immersus RN42]|uniref:PXA domain-containing protein n=1 Tax=Ascobolus immersus RN42 TaxID=1160509 RepID=A0A3N4ITS2_ASCIM|nr:hypothetical protein BJ508DRAFT_300842 [Ascobolus immersus RN42]
MMRRTETDDKRNDCGGMDQDTISLIRRTLIPSEPPTKPLEDLLPALTSSQDVDIELYALLSIIFQEFITPWYNELSTASTFPSELTLLIAHLTLTFQSRLSSFPTIPFFFEFIPSVLEDFVLEGRRPTPPTPHPSTITTACADGAQAQPQIGEQEYFRVLCEELVEIILTTEERESDVARTLVRELLVKILGIVTDMLGKEWMWWDTLLKFLPPVPDPADPTPPKPRDWFGYLETATTVFTTTIKILYTAFANPPPRPPTAPNKKNQKPTPQHPQLLLSTPLPQFLLTFLTLPDNAPWTSSSLLLFLHPFTLPSPIALTIDATLRSKIKQTTHNPQIIRDVLRKIRTGAFPDDRFPPKKDEPTPEQTEEMRNEVYRRWDARLGGTGGIGTGEEVLGWIRVLAERGRLGVMVRRIVEGALCKVFPELGVVGE